MGEGRESWRCDTGLLLVVSFIKWPNHLTRVYLSINPIHNTIHASFLLGVLTKCYIIFNVISHLAELVGKCCTSARNREHSRCYFCTRTGTTSVHVLATPCRVLTEICGETSSVVYEVDKAPAHADHGSIGLDQQ